MGAKADIARAELREARIKIDRMKVQAAQREALLMGKIDRLEEETEALRNTVATLARNGEGAVL